MTDKPICRVCGELLNSNNWYKSYQKNYDYLCKECDNKRSDLYRKDNPEKTKANITRTNRKNGHILMSENKECPAYLGVCITEHGIAENALNNIYKNVVRMPYKNPWYDFICNDNIKIDSKGSCIQKNQNGWLFNINHNIIADYFICVAFDNLTDLKPIHIWLIPGEKVNHLKGLTISKSTLYKWDAYKLDISKVISYCDITRTV